jgi:omega-amidase
MNLKISFVQSKLFWQDIKSNLEYLERKIDEMHQVADVIVLPEMFSTGFSMQTNQAESMDGEALKWMQRLSIQKQAAITGSLMIKEKGFIYNRLVWMFPDGSFEVYDKRHLFRMANENESFTAGNRRLIVQYKGWNICPLICYDLRFPVWSRNQSSNSGLAYDLLIYVANWPERRALAWNSLLPARAIENQAFVLGVNRVGSDGNDISYSGDSGLYNYLGERISQANRFMEKVEIIEISKAELLKYRESFPAYADADEFKLYV